MATGVSSNFNILQMRRAMELREQLRDAQNPNTINISEILQRLDDYKAILGSETLRQIHAENGNDWRRTLQACQDALVGLELASSCVQSTAK